MVRMAGGNVRTESRRRRITSTGEPEPAATATANISAPVDGAASGWIDAAIGAFSYLEMTQHCRALV